MNNIPYQDIISHSTLPSTHLRFPRLHLPLSPDWPVSQLKSTRSRRNLVRINYCELNDTTPERRLNGTHEDNSDSAAKITTDQDTIGWEQFIRGRLSISFSFIVFS